MKTQTELNTQPLNDVVDGVTVGVTLTEGVGVGETGKVGIGVLVIVGVGVIVGVIDQHLIERMDGIFIVVRV